jgi:histidine phosphotransferase ChpT
MLMTDETIEFASLLCSRLCHDLLSPVGSFGNGIELIRDESEPEMKARYIDLLDSSSRAAINRLKFFRLAFGSSGGFGERLAVADIVEAVQGLVPETRSVVVSWVGNADPVDKNAARVLLALSTVAVDALVRGGRIDMAIEQRGEMLELALRAAGDRVIIDDALVTAFDPADTSAPTPKVIAIALARRITRQSGGDILLSRPAPGELVVGAMLKSEQ